jgi:hypothetical protein
MGAAARLTLVTLDCTPFHIGTSVSAKSGVVYSLGVLRLQASVAKGGSPAWSYRLMSAQRLEAALGRGPG